MEELCCTCLCAGRKMFRVSENCVYSFFKQIMNEMDTQMEMLQEAQICWECCALLRRFQAFQTQAKTCYTQLIMCLQLNPSTKLSLAKEPHLSIYETHNISTKPFLQEVKKEIDDEIDIFPETFVDLKLLPETDYILDAEINKKRKKVKRKSNEKPESDIDMPSEAEDTLADIDFESCEKNEFSCKECESFFETESELLDHIDDEHAVINKKEKRKRKLKKGKKKKESIKNDVDLPTDVEEREIEDAVPEESEKREPIKRTRVPVGGAAGGGERPQCAECGKVFSSRKTYRYHLKVLHKGDNKHPCPRCGKVYQWKSNLGRHMRSHKAVDSGELHCAPCDKWFSSVATYRQHVRVSRRHVDETDFAFSCSECGKKFVNKTRLQDHVDWEHLHKIKFRCQLCNKPFKCHTSLYVHMQNVHSDKEKNNLCHVCGKAYLNAAKLKYHIVAMHTSATPYRCTRCDAAFGWYSSLYRHVREVHYKMKVQTKKSKKSKKIEELGLELAAPAPVLS